MSVERPPADIVSRLRRFAGRASSPADLVYRASEEAFVRFWSHEKVRAAFRPLLPAREPRNWAFLAGCYNSGTTLLQSILGAHPAIATLPREGVRFTAILSNLEENGHHMMWDASYQDFVAPDIPVDAAKRQIAKDWSVFWKRGAEVYLDKSIANAARVDWLAKAFINAKFVGIHRDGRCIAEGLHRRAQPPAWLKAQTGSDSYPLEMCARQWVIANEDMLGAFENNPDSMLVSFETFVADPAGELERIFRHLGVSVPPMTFSAGILNIGGRTFEIRDPNPSSLARLSAKDTAIIEPVIGPMMRKLGYGGVQ